MFFNFKQTAMLVLLGIGVNGLISCGPMYDTQYTFIPPESAQGKACTYQCQNGKYQCEQIDRMQVDRCEESARREQERCKWDLAFRGEKEHWYDCALDSCSANTEQCEAQYRSCFQMCGGTVNTQTVCVANCQQAQPVPPGR